MNWEILSADNQITLGGSCVSIDKEIYIIGGQDQQTNKTSNYLNIATYSLEKLDYVTRHINSNGIYNRRNHTAVAFKDDIVVMGGYNTSSIGADIFSEMITCKKTAFGLKCDVETVTQLGRFGHSCNVFGDGNRAIVFGGNGLDSKPMEDMWIYRHFTPEARRIKEEEVKKATPEGEEPTPVTSWIPVELEPSVSGDQNVPSPCGGRSFHSSVVCGENNQYLVVFGGRTAGTTTLTVPPATSDDREVVVTVPVTVTTNEVWVLDLTAYCEDAPLPPPDVLDAKGKKVPPKKDAPGPVKPTASWIRVSDGSNVFKGRSYHTVFNTDNKNLPSSCIGTFAIVGGLDEYNAAFDLYSNVTVAADPNSTNGVGPLMIDLIKTSNTEYSLQLSEVSLINTNTNLEGLGEVGSGILSGSNDEVFDSISPNDNTMNATKNTSSFGCYYTLLRGSDGKSLDGLIALNIRSVDIHSNQPGMKSASASVASLEGGSGQTTPASNSRLSRRVVRTRPGTGADIQGCAISPTYVKLQAFLVEDTSELTRIREQVAANKKAILKKLRGGVEEEEEDNTLKNAYLALFNRTFATETESGNSGEYSGSCAYLCHTDEFEVEFGETIKCIHADTFVTKEQEALIVKSVNANDGDYSCVKDGEGVYTVKQDNVVISTYMGSWVKDSMNGEGCLVLHKEQTVYKGLFANNCYTEFGKLFIGQGSVDSNKCAYYVGEFLNGKRHGSGTLYEVENVGLVDNDRLVEKVGMILINNTTSSSIIMSVEGVYKAQLVYEGGWVDDEMSGHGTRILSDGSTYTGPLSRNLPHGSDGVCIYGDGSKYVGQWRHGLRNGVGTYTTAKQEEYVGKWVADQRCGKGVWKSMLTGETYDGLWENHVPHGYGVRVYSDKNQYTGDFVNGQRHGVGTMVYKQSADSGTSTNTRIAPGSSTYSGDWFMDQRHGMGKWVSTSMGVGAGSSIMNIGSNSTMSFRNMDYEISYEGEWHSDQRNGQGKSVTLSGNVYNGLYQADEQKPF